MLFTLKKILSSLLMPMSIGLIILFIGLYFLYRNKLAKAKLFLSVGVIWITIMSYAPFSNTFISGVENRYQRVDIFPSNVKHILLLGGDKEARAWEALRLYNLIDDAKIITSGYAGVSTKAGAINTAKFLEEAGVNKKDLIIHIKPKDTKEEVLAMKEAFGENPFFLVTSAYHMPRAMALFEKEGLHPIAAPIDYKILGYDETYSIPSGFALHRTEVAWHEYMGLLWSTLRGQI